MAHLTQLAHLSQNLHRGKESCGAALGRVEAGPSGPQRRQGSPRPLARHRRLRSPQSARTIPQDGPTMERIAHKHLRSHFCQTSSTTACPCVAPTPPARRTLKHTGLNGRIRHGLLFHVADPQNASERRFEDWRSSPSVAPLKRSSVAGFSTQGVQACSRVRRPTPTGDCVRTSLQRDGTCLVRAHPRSSAIRDITTGTSSTGTAATHVGDRSPDGLELLAKGDVGSQRAQAGTSAIVMIKRVTRRSSTHRPFIGTHRASEGRWTPTQDSLSSRLREYGRAQWGHCGTARPHARVRPMLDFTHSHLIALLF